MTAYSGDHGGGGGGQGTAVSVDFAASMLAIDLHCTDHLYVVEISMPPWLLHGGARSGQTYCGNDVSTYVAMLWRLNGGGMGRPQCFELSGQDLWRSLELRRQSGLVQCRSLMPITGNQ